MTILPVIQTPHPALNIPAKPVESFDDELATLAQDMTETMLENNLVGLCAVQVGILQSVIVVEFGNKDSSNPIVLVNPKIEYIKSSGKSWQYEGCGSIQKVIYNVERVNSIRVTAQNIHGNIVGLHLDGFLSRVVQHEENHCRGILISKIGRDRRIIK